MRKLRFRPPDQELALQQLRCAIRELDEQQNQELVVGTIWQFWKLSLESSALRIVTAASFSLLTSLTIPGR